eukprot:scaffold84014_cov58-Phaeocystis_antarctica.AAC.1
MAQAIEAVLNQSKRKICAKPAPGAGLCVRQRVRLLCEEVPSVRGYIYLISIGRSAVRARVFVYHGGEEPGYRVISNLSRYDLV